MPSLSYWPINLDVLPDIRIIAARSSIHKGARQWTLPRLWAVHFYEYEATLTLAGGITHSICPGDVSVIPPSQTVTYHWPRASCHAYTHFSLVPTQKKCDAPTVIPAVQNLGSRFDALHRQFLEATAWNPQKPHRTAVRLSDILYTLINHRPSLPSLDNRSQQAEHPAVVHAVQFIKAHLSEPLRVTQLTRYAGISANHLNRLFHQAYGSTMTSYVRHQRILRAQHWLIHTTLPIKQVAFEVGVSDLQQFNKFMRRYTGLSPRQIRRRAIHTENP